MVDLCSFEEMTGISLLRHLNETDEHARCEAKRSSELGKSLQQSICAFANEPGLGGGFILCGVAPSAKSLFPVYEAVGVPDPNKLQEDIASACRTQFNRPLRPKMKVDIVAGKSVVIVFVPELGPGEKPLFFTSDGLPKGAYRRCGSTDQKCSEDDLIVFYGQQSFESFERQAVPDATLSDIDPNCIALYRTLRQKIKPDAEELAWNDQDLLLSTSAVRTVNGVLIPTVAGLILFGTPQALRRVFPLMRVDYIRVQGTKWVEDPDERFEAITVREALLTSIRRICSIVLADLPRAYSMTPGDIQRDEAPILPETVIREVIVNAVMHRCYRVHGAVQVIRYNNRIEVRNPGHSLISEEQFGQPTSQTRNPVIAAALYDLGFAENKGSGLRAVQTLMKKAMLPPPNFESNRDANRFVAYLLMHHLMTPDDVKWLSSFSQFSLSEDEKVAMIIAREMGAIDNATYRSLCGCDTLTASGHLRRLRDLSIVVQRGKGNKTYYVLQDFPEGQSGGLEGKSGGGLTKSGGLGGKVGGSRGDRSANNEEDVTPLELPTEVAERLPKIAGKNPRAAVRRAILELCSWRPLMPSEIALFLTKKSSKRLVEDYISPMHNEGVLERTIPANPAHPAQKYKTTALGAAETMVPWR